MSKKVELVRAAKQEEILDLIFDAIHAGKDKFRYKEKLENIVLPLPAGMTIVAFGAADTSDEGYIYTINKLVAKEIVENYMQILCHIWLPVAAYYKLHPILYWWMKILHLLQTSDLPSTASEDVAETIYEELKGAGVIPFNDIESLQMV